MVSSTHTQIMSRLKGRVSGEFLCDHIAKNAGLYILAIPLPVWEISSKMKEGRGKKKRQKKKKKKKTYEREKREEKRGKIYSSGGRNDVHTNIIYTTTKMHTCSPF